MQVSIVGIGMGGAKGLTTEALEALRSSDLVVGAQRMLQTVEGVLERTGYMPGLACAVAAPAVVDALAGSAAGQAAVACSGDVGFYSMAQSLLACIEQRRLPWKVELVPGVSSPQFLAARLGRPWHDVHLVSAHGRNCYAVGEVLAHERTFFLAGGEQGVASLARELTEAGLGSASATVAERLGYPDERIRAMSAEEASEQQFDPLSCLLVERGTLREADVEDAAGFGGIPDVLFERGSAPMTKAPVRCLVTARLRPRPGQVVWDVGAGTGSVAVEAACMEPRARVFAIERDGRACALVDANRRRFGTYNVTVVEGRAPDVLEGLPAPDAVFVGGSGGEFAGIVEAALLANPRVRICATAVTLETMTMAWQMFSQLKEQGRLCDVGAVQAGFASARPAGSFHLVQAQNPVWVFDARGTGAPADGERDAR